MLNRHDNATAKVERLAKACETFARQWRGGHPPGHDAVVELHRALKACVPGLNRPEFEKVESGESKSCANVSARAVTTSSAVKIVSALRFVGARNTTTGAASFATKSAPARSAARSADSKES